MTRKLTFLILALFALIAGPGAKAWGQTTASVELCTSWGQTLAYATAYTHDYTIDDLNGGTTTMTLGVLGVYRQGNANTYFQMNKKDGYFKNTTKLPGKITKIETTWNVDKGPTKCYFATNAEATSEDKTVTVTAATSVTYTPPTDTDYYFFNIDVSTGSGSAQMTSCKVYYEAKPAHTLTLSATDGSIAAMNGETVIESGDDVEEGAELNISATANDWYKFSGWNVSGTGSTLGSTTENPTTFTMGTTNATLTATFAACVVTVSSNDENWGIALYDDESHTISTAAEDGYRISSTEPYTINPADAATLAPGEGGEYTVSGVKDQDVEITINFEAIPTATYTVTFNAGTNGTCSTTELTEAEAGAGITLPEVTPNTGYQFVGWATTNTATTADAGVAGEPYYPSATTTLYAVYNSVYTITWIVNGTPLTEGEQTTSVVEGEGITTLPTTPSDISEMKFQGWTATQIGTPSATAPTDLFTDAEHAPAITNNTTFYAVFAEESEGEATWTKITSVPEAGTYAILTTNYFMKAEIISNRFANGSETPAISNDKLTTAPAEDCIWEISKPDTYYRIKNGNNYAGGTNSKNQGALLTDANSDLAKWSISYNNNEFVITNYGRSQASSDSGNKYLRNNGTNGWATYASSTGNAPMLFKKVVTTTYSNYCTTIVEKVLTGISLSGEYPTEFWKGETFSHEGMIVTAHYSNAPDAVVTEDATFSTPDMTTVGNKTITVTYDTKSTTYEIAVKTIANTQETAYTVAEAKTIIDANPAELTTVNVYVKGTVSKNDGLNNDGTITYWLDNNAFEVYKGKNIGNEIFTSADEISVGDDVVVYGKIKKYYSTYEFDAGNYLVSHIKASTLTIDNITVEIGGTITPVIETNVPETVYTIAYSVASEEFVKVQDGNLVTVAVGGPVEVTATLTAEGYKEATTTFEVEVIKALASITVKTAPTTTSYKAGDFFDPTGLVITATYSDATTEDVPYAENEDKFTFEPSLETALTTGNTFVTITYAGKETTLAIEVRALYTYNITWKANGIAVTLEPATVVEGGQIGTLPTPEAEYIPEGFTFAGWSTSMASTTAITETFNVTENTYLYAIFARVEGGSGATTWNLVTDASQISAGDIIKIAATANGASNSDNNGTFAADGIISNSIMGRVSATISNNQLTGEGAAEFTIGGTASEWTLSNGNGELLGATAAKKIAWNDGTTTWTISINNYAEASISNTNTAYGTILYNRDSPRFTTYTSDPTAAMVLPQIFVKTISTVTHYYTRVFNETATANITIAGPSIIPAGSTLNMGTYSLTSGTAANLIIEDGAQLIQNSEGVKATVLKDITGYSDAASRDGYYLVANPTAIIINENGEEDEYDALDGCAQFDLYSFNPTEALEWRNIGSTSQKVTFERNVGYLFASANNTTVNFRGYLLPAGEIEITLVKATEGPGIDFPGFNLIGNPYTCNAYPTDEDGNFMPFYKMNEDGSELELVENVEAIAPCQGFFVEANANGDKVTISTTAPEPASLLSLSVSQNRGNVIDRAIVNFDGRNNLHKFMMNPAHTNISLAKNGEEFAAISTSSTSGELPVNFKAEKNGTYTITVDTENVDAEYLHLIDNKTGMDIDLLASTGSASYTFEAKASDYASRFKLVFGVNNTDSESSASNFAYMSDGNLVIDNIEGQATLQIVDELGRVISTETVNGSYNKALNLKAGLYIINLNGMTQKIVVE